jgi:serine/threonine protein kinase
MSEIYRAFDLVNIVEVALKLPEAALIGDPAQYGRFQREIEDLRILDHPAVLKGLGAHRTTYSNLSATMGTPDYLAPEQVEGHLSKY